jgi:BMFP domain-containing protein YqiC
MKYTELLVVAKAFGIETRGLKAAQLEEAVAIAKATTRKDLEQAVENALQAATDLPDTATTEEKEAATAVLSDAHKALTLFEETYPAEINEEPTPETIEYNGREYGFSDSAPERFNFLGQNKSQAEWLADEDAMELLIAGKNSFITQIRK